MSPFAWRSESDTPPPEQISPVDDALTADEAVRRVRKGEFLLYRGDFHNARQLLAAMARRLPAPRHGSSPLAAFRAERGARSVEHDTLGRVVVELDRDYALALKRAPDVSTACRWAWGPSDAARTVLALKTLLGVFGAAQWRTKGLSVPGLPQPLTPHYGVYAPTRTDYVELLRKLGDVKGTRCFDIGTGTGVLALLLLQRGAASVVGTDIEPRAVACATENARRFGVLDRFTLEERSLFPDGQADLIVCNPPWVPEPPKNRVDRAVFDMDSQVLTGFLEGLPAHLTERGRGALLLSNLAELLGLRPPGFLEAQFDANGLERIGRFEMAAKHGKARDTNDPLHHVRSKEVTTLHVLVRGGAHHGG